MASATKIVLSADDRGNFHVGNSAEAAQKVSELLQHNLENHHILFSGRRHNHILHYILTIYALGASPAEIQQVYDREAAYQKPRFPVNENDVQAMNDKSRFKEFLDDPRHYSSYLVYFQKQIEAKGVEAVLNEHVFANDEHANRMLVRMFASIIHPVIHLGFALEFNQPAIVAEALAEAAVHEGSLGLLGTFLLSTEKVAGRIGMQGKKTLRQLMEEMRTQKTLRESHLNGTEIERVKTVMTNALDEMVKYASQYTVSAHQLEKEMLDMVNVVSCTIATIPDPPDSYKVNFFLLHIVNTLVLLPSLIKHPWLSSQNKIRLLEWQGRYDLLLYTAESSPKLSTEDVVSYKGRLKTWAELFDYSIHHTTDDGHLAKLLRSLAFGQQAMKPLQEHGNLLFQDDTWLKLGNLAADSVPKSALTSEDRWGYL